MMRGITIFAALLLALVPGSLAVGADSTGGLTPVVVIHGAPVHGANGLAMDQDGHLIVASALGRELAVVDPASGEVVDHLGPFIGDMDVGGPDDVALAPDGSLCWTDTMGGFVDCLRPDGSVGHQFVAPGVNPIAFLPDGRMFVAQAFGGDALFEVDPALVEAPRLILSGSGVEPWPDQLNGFDFGPDGMLYAPRPFAAAVVRIDVDAEEPTAEVVTTGTIFGSVEFGPDGNLYGSSPVTGEVDRIDLGSGDQTVYAVPGPNLDNMVFGDDGILYVSNSNDGRLFSVPPGGGQVEELSGAGLIAPGGIAAAGVDDTGADRLYVADWWSLPELDGATGDVTAIDWNSHGGGTVTSPNTVAMDGDNVIATSLFANQVQIWDPVSDLEVASWTDFAAPTNAIAFGDDLVVAELGSGSVVAQSTDGTRTAIATGLQVPVGLAADGSDLWVSDWATGTVWQIVTDGAPTMTAVATDLANPEGLAVDTDGSLLVVESGPGRLTRILSSGETEVLAEGLTLGIPATPGMPPAYIMNGVAVGDSGAIYVTSDQTSTVWRME